MTEVLLALPSLILALLLLLAANAVSRRLNQASLW